MMFGSTPNCLPILGMSVEEADGGKGEGGCDTLMPVLDDCVCGVDQGPVEVEQKAIEGVHLLRE